MNKKLIISLSTIAAVAIVAIGASVAYFSNTETSAGNTFIAGAIDLKVDNECMLNGQIVQDCTWETPINLDGKAIFNFTDVKPGDDGEDTISLHVDTNPAWVCAEVSSVTSTENGCNSPEKKVDPLCETETEGDLWSVLKFSLWMDNGAGEHACNNFKDDDETYLVENAGASDIKWPIADSQTGGEPIRDACIGVAWSVPDEVGNEIQGDSVIGDITFYAYQARNNANFLCNPPTTGTLTVYKTVVGGDADPSSFALFVDGDSVTNGVATEQSPGNHVVTETPDSDYSLSFSGDCDSNGNVNVPSGGSATCTLTNTRKTGNLTVIKHVVGGSAVAGDFTISVIGSNPIPASFSGSESGTGVSIGTGAYSVSESPVSNYTVSYSDECEGTIAFSDTKTCTITNTADLGTITVHKIVVNNDVGTKNAGDFQMTIDSGDVAQDTPIEFGVGNHTVSEANNYGYDMTYSAECPDGVVNVVKDTNTTCTVTNIMPYFTVTVTKVVNNFNGGDNVVADFDLFVGSTQVTSGDPKKVAVGTYLINESGVGGYDGEFTGDCDSDTQLLMGADGDTKTCTITNADIKPNITLIKQVIGGTALPTDFIMRVDGVPVPSGGSKLVTSNTGHTITEDVKAGYTGTISGDAKCPSVLGGTATLDEGEAITCTITNTSTP